MNTLDILNWLTNLPNRILVEYSLFSNNLTEAINSITAGETLFLFILIPLLVWCLSVALFHRWFMKMLPGGQTMWGWAFLTGLIFTPLIAWLTIYLFMNFFNGWVSIDILSSLFK